MSPAEQIQTPAPYLHPERARAFERGQWVKVWGIVVDRPNHPDDIAVQFESHNEHYIGHVRRDHVLQPGFSAEEHPATATQCTHLGRTEGGSFMRCESFEGPGHVHRWGIARWIDAETVGYFEER